MPASGASLLLNAEGALTAVLAWVVFREGFDRRVGLGMLAIVTAATVAGKVAGTALPARLSGEGWPTALVLGALMQTKGLMEVVVLTVLLDAGLIGPGIFSAMVAMAILCTLATVPLTRLALSRQGGQALPAEQAEPRAAG